MVHTGQRKWKVSQKLFVDDTAFVAERREELQILVIEFEMVCNRRKLEEQSDEMQ